MLFIKKLEPKTIFLIDGIGALLSAIMLALVMVRYQNIFGIPQNMLYFLAIWPCVFAVYDCYCFINKTRDNSTRLRVIALLNLIYIILSFLMATKHQAEIHGWGWAYIVAEIIVLFVLVNIELVVAKHHTLS